MKNLDKTSIIGIVCCIAVMIALFVRMNDRAAVAEKKRAEQQAAMPTDAAVQPAEVPVSQGTADGQAAPAVSPAPAVPAGTPVVASSPAALPAADPLLPAGTAPRKKSTVVPIELKRNGEAVFRIDPANGVVAVEMEKYRKQPDGKGEPAPVILGNYDYPFLTLGTVNGPSQWQAMAADAVTSDAAAGMVSARRLSTDGTLELTECWTLPEKDAYEINYTVSVKNLTANPVQFANAAVEVGALSPLMAGSGESGFGGVSYMLPPAEDNHCEEYTAGNLKKFAEARAKMNDPNLTESERMDAAEDLKTVHDLAWAAVHTRYFMQAVRSRDSKFRFSALEAFSCETMPEDSKQDPFGRFRARLVMPAVILNPGETRTFELAGFAGPMDLNLLSKKNIGLEGALGVDRFFMWTPKWMGGLSKFFLNSLLWLSRLFPGKMAIGLALILLTVIVKLVFWPLSHRGSRSMKKMQELQPQLKEIRDKYKSDPQEMYRRQQQLYKDNNVSQLGGCLPMLVQIPIFFALFNTFRGSIELRQACFLWASDLSMPDTVLDLGFVGLNPMALIMVGTMLWQQMITPSGDPSQKRMMVIMSVLFTYFLYTQPSGLTLYMTVNQLLSMLQFAIIRKLDAREEAKKKTAVKTNTASK